jgi:hypothetical protein
MLKKIATTLQTASCRKLQLAIAIAEAVLIPIYGLSQVEAQKPFSTSLKNGSWIVLGHLRAGDSGGVARLSSSSRQVEYSE